MGTKVRLVAGTYYEDQDGTKWNPGDVVEMDEQEAKLLINGGSGVRMDSTGSYVESETE